MGQKRKISFTGYIDRIDKIGDQYRVIDYKSGKVKDEDVKFVDKDTELLSFQKCKHAVQLTLYAMFLKENRGFYPAETSIFSLTDVQNMSYVLNSKTKRLERYVTYSRSFLKSYLKKFLMSIKPLSITRTQNIVTTVNKKNLKRNQKLFEIFSGNLQVK
jgi:predicted RecB family nuclease